MTQVFHEAPLVALQTNKQDVAACAMCMRALGDIKMQVRVCYIGTKKLGSAPLRCRLLCLYQPYGSETLRAVYKDTLFLLPNAHGNVSHQDSLGHTYYLLGFVVYGDKLMPNRIVHSQL